MGVSKDSRDISGEACWDQLSSLHALKFVNIVDSGHVEQENGLPNVCSECGKGMLETALRLFIHKESYSVYITVFVHE